MLRTDEEYKKWWTGLADWERFEIIERVEEEAGWTPRQKDLASSFLDQMKGKRELSPKQIRIVQEWSEVQRR